MAEFPATLNPIDPALIVDDSLPFLVRLEKVCCNKSRPVNQRLAHLRMIPGFLQTASAGDVHQLVYQLDALGCDRESRQVLVGLCPALAAALLTSTSTTASTTASASSNASASASSTDAPAARAAAVDACATVCERVIPFLRTQLLDGGESMRAVTVDACVSLPWHIARTPIGHHHQQHQQQQQLQQQSLSSVAPEGLCAVVASLLDVAAECGSEDCSFRTRTAAARLLLPLLPLAAGLVRAAAPSSDAVAAKAQACLHMVHQLGTDHDDLLRESAAAALRAAAAARAPLCAPVLQQLQQLSQPQPEAAVAAAPSALQAEAQALTEKLLVSLAGAGAHKHKGGAAGGDGGGDDGEGEEEEDAEAKVRAAAAEGLAAVASGASPATLAAVLVPVLERLLLDRDPAVAVRAYAAVGQLLALLLPAADAQLLATARHKKQAHGRVRRKSATGAGGFTASGGGGGGGGGGGFRGGFRGPHHHAALLAGGSEPLAQVGLSSSHSHSHSHSHSGSSGPLSVHTGHGHHRAHAHAQAHSAARSGSGSSSSGSALPSLSLATERLLAQFAAMAGGDVLQPDGGVASRARGRAGTGRGSGEGEGEGEGEGGDISLRPPSGGASRSESTGSAADEYAPVINSSLEWLAPMDSTLSPKGSFGGGFGGGFGGFSGGFGGPGDDATGLASSGSSSSFVVRATGTGDCDGDGSGSGSGSGSGAATPPLSTPYDEHSGSGSHQPFPSPATDAAPRLTVNSRASSDGGGSGSGGGDCEATARPHIKLARSASGRALPALTRSRSGTGTAIGIGIGPVAPTLDLSLMGGGNSSDAGGHGLLLNAEDDDDDDDDEEQYTIKTTPVPLSTTGRQTSLNMADLALSLANSAVSSAAGSKRSSVNLTQLLGSGGINNLEALATGLNPPPPPPLAPAPASAATATAPAAAADARPTVRQSVRPVVVDAGAADTIAARLAGAAASLADAAVAAKPPAASLSSLSSPSRRGRGRGRGRRLSPSGGGDDDDNEDEDEEGEEEEGPSGFMLTLPPANILHLDAPPAVLMAAADGRHTHHQHQHSQPQLQQLQQLQQSHVRSRSGSSSGSSGSRSSEYNTGDYNDYFDDGDDSAGESAYCADSDIVAASVGSWQVGDLGVRRAQASARTLPGVLRAALLEPATAVMEALRQLQTSRRDQRGGAAASPRPHLRRHRLRALLTRRLHLGLRALRRLLARHDGGAVITTTLVNGLHETLTSLLAGAVAAHELSADIKRRYDSSSGWQRTAPAPAPPAAATAAAVAAATASTASAASMPARRATLSRQESVVESQLSALTQSRICDCAVAALAAGLSRREDGAREAALAACGKVLPLLADSHHERLVVAMLTAAGLADTSAAATASKSSSDKSPSPLSGFMTTATATATATTSSSAAAPTAAAPKPGYTIANHSGWRLRHAFALQLPSIVPVVSCGLLVSRLTPAILRLVHDPVSTVRQVAAHALAVDLGALWHFAKKPAPMHELAATHIRRLMPSAAAAAAAATAGPVTAVTAVTAVIAEDTGAAVPPPAAAAPPSVGFARQPSFSLPSLSSLSLALSSADAAAAASSSTSTSTGTGTGGGTGPASSPTQGSSSSSSSSGSSSTSSAVAAEAAACLQAALRTLTAACTPEASHPDRVAYMQLCAALLCLRDRDRDRDREAEGGAAAAAAAAPPAPLAAAAPAPVTAAAAPAAAAPPPPVLHPLVDPRLDVHAHLSQPVCALAPVAAAFIAADCFQPCSVGSGSGISGGGGGGGGGFGGSGGFGGGSSLSLSLDDPRNDLPQWWRDAAAAALQLPSVYESSLETVAGTDAAAAAAAAATASTAAAGPWRSPDGHLDTLPAFLRDALHNATSHAPRTRTAEELRSASLALYDFHLRLPLLRLLRTYPPGSFWWRQLIPLAGSVAAAVAETEWRPRLAHQAIERQAAQHVRRQRWAAEEERRAREGQPTDAAAAAAVLAASNEEHAPPPGFVLAPAPLALSASRRRSNTPIAPPPFPLFPATAGATADSSASDATTSAATADAAADAAAAAGEAAGWSATSSRAGAGAGEPALDEEDVAERQAAVEAAAAWASISIRAAADGDGDGDSDSN